MSEAEYLMKNYGDRGGCYPSRPYCNYSHSNYTALVDTAGLSRPCSQLKFSLSHAGLHRGNGPQFINPKHMMLFEFSYFPTLL